MLKEYAAQYKNKKVGFVGMGVSNLPVIRLFISAGALCVVRDKNDLQDKDFYPELAENGVEFITGEGYLEDISEDLLFLSPAVRPDLKGLQKAREKGTRVTSEMEEFFRLCPCKKIAVTGSDGKTTTTTLISKLLTAAGYKAWLGGNIGINLFATLDDINETDFAVVELSSFQLMKLSMSPDIAVVTNVAPNHLDWHIDMNEYVVSKMNIFNFQNSDSILVLNEDDQYSADFALKAKGVVRKISGNNKSDIYFNDEGIFKGKELLVKDSDIRIVGRHNRYNYCQAYSAVQDYVSADALREVAGEFGGVEHRIEFVRQLDGIKYYNSSIDSSPSRTKACLESFKNKNVIAICGGYDKNIPYEPLGELFTRKVKFAVLCGATAVKIAKVLDSVGYTDYEIIPDFEIAIKTAKEKAENGDNVVLTPASASFDMFRNFAERGNKFKEIVKSL